MDDIPYGPLVGEKLRDELVTLFERVSSSLSSEVELQLATKTKTSGDVFESVDVAIIDNNLAALEIAGTRVTAENIVGYIRAFTDVAYIVSLNKNPDVDFDLRYLVGDYQSQADVALNTSHLGSKVLWNGHGTCVRLGEIAPWYWPNLASASARRRCQVASLEKRSLDAHVVDLLGFPIECVEALSRRAKGALSSEAVHTATLRQVSLLDFFEHACRAVPAADRDEMSNRARDGDPEAKKWIVRLVAADLEKWVRRDVLGPQDVLVDLPHLLTRMPFLLGEDAVEGREWNRMVSAKEPPFGLVGEMYEEHLVGAMFEDALMWIGTPCFWWPKLRGIKELSSLFFESDGQWADVVFCEDVSEFRPLSESDLHEERSSDPVEFEAEFEGAWRRRYVAVVPRQAILSA